jgi:FkbM family methyltransferase
MATAEVLFEGVSTIFEIDNPHDHIQAFQARGAFYELQQLLAHRCLIPMHSTVIDIGANCGNHTLFYAYHTRACKIYPFEPNPPALQLLLRNVAANCGTPGSIDTSLSDCALGYSYDWVKVRHRTEDNLGATRLGAAGPDDHMKCVKLDNLALVGDIAFIKIDVEGMEMEVLRGAENIFSRSRPALAIEVESANEAEFWNWARSHEYQLVNAFRDYLPVWNFIMVPTR